MVAAGDPIYASDINAILTRLGTTGWASYTPVLYQAMGTTPTVLAGTTGATGDYRILDGMVFFHAEATAGATSTGGLGITLPTTSSSRWLNCGSAVLMGTGTNVWPAAPTASNVPTAHAYMASTKDKLVLVSWSGGFNMQCVSGNTVRVSGIYMV